MIKRIKAAWRLRFGFAKSGPSLVKFLDELDDHRRDKHSSLVIVPVILSGRATNKGDRIDRMTSNLIYPEDLCAKS